MDYTTKRNLKDTGMGLLYTLAGGMGGIIGTAGSYLPISNAAHDYPYYTPVVEELNLLINQEAAPSPEQIAEFEATFEQFKADTGNQFPAHTDTLGMINTMYDGNPGEEEYVENEIIGIRDDLYATQRGLNGNAMAGAFLGSSIGLIILLAGSSGAVFHFYDLYDRKRRKQRVHEVSGEWVNAKGKS